MKNMKIGAKIFFGFFCLFALLLLIAVTAIVVSQNTGSNINQIEVYNDLQENTNSLMHILNETRITARAFYETYSPSVYSNLSKQIMYCDVRLKMLNEYLAGHPELSAMKTKISDFESLYTQWRSGVQQMGTSYPLDEGLSEEMKAAFDAQAVQMNRLNLLAHEVLSNTGGDISDITIKEIENTQAFNRTAVIIVIALSAFSLVAAIGLSVSIMRSITRPMGYMQSVLSQIGRLGDLKMDEETMSRLREIAAGRDETAQCTAALVTMLEHMHVVDSALSRVAGGDLTVSIPLQSKQDTMGLAVEQMVANLNQKFGTISQSTNWVSSEAVALSGGSVQLAQGCQTQLDSISHLSESVQRISQKTTRNTDLARQASQMIGTIQQNAGEGTAKMSEMITAAQEIAEASNSISKVIKAIDDIAFQTNILALNAAVEASRAGAQGKGFAVVAEEVRNLATKSAEAAQSSGTLIEDTIRKAELGSSIAGQTAQSLDKIVGGVRQSTAIIEDMAKLSHEQSEDIRQIISDITHVEKITDQSNDIASQSTQAAGAISDQSNLLKELVSQFRLAGGR